MKQAILVIGTGRSGTSAMAGMLQICGAWLGDELKPGDAVNPKGYFENTRITDQNKAALAEAGLSWYGSVPDLMHAVPVTAALRKATRDCIARVFAERSPIAIKDPRLCVLLDTYVTVMCDMGYELHAVRMLRDPNEVARSMTAAAGAEPSHWLPMARRYAELLDAALQRTGIDCVDVTFDDLVTNTAATVRRIAVRLPFLRSSDAKIDEVLGFIDHTLKHH